MAIVELIPTREGVADRSSHAQVSLLCQQSSTIVNRRSDSCHGILVDLRWLIRRHGNAHSPLIIPPPPCRNCTWFNPPPLSHPLTSPPLNHWSSPMQIRGAGKWAWPPHSNPLFPPLLSFTFLASICALPQCWFIRMYTHTHTSARNAESFGGCSPSRSNPSLRGEGEWGGGGRGGRGKKKMSFD